MAYIRVSTGDQHLGVDAQQTAIEAWAQRNGIQVAAVHVDQGVSGGSDINDRPGLIAAIGELRVHGAGVMVVLRRDRLARDLYVAGTIERAVAQCGARVVAADGVGAGETPADDFMKSILDAAAAYERALIRARTKAALSVKRSRGERVGGVQYGFRVGDDGRTLVPDDAEQWTIFEVRRLRAAGWSFRSIRLELTAVGLVSRAGRPFSLQAIFEMTKRGPTPRGTDGGRA